jgi:hypothetical protein
MRINPKATDGGKFVLNKTAVMINQIKGSSVENAQEGGDEDDGLDASKNEEVIMLKTDNKDVGTIMVEIEYRFMLLRFWNLYDSVYYSNYVAS